MKPAHPLHTRPVPSKEALAIKPQTVGAVYVWNAAVGPGRREFSLQVVICSSGEECRYATVPLTTREGRKPPKR